MIPLFRRFDCYATLQQRQFGTWKVLWNTPGFWRAKQMIAFSSGYYLYVTLLTSFIKGVHRFQPNRQKGPW